MNVRRLRINKRHRGKRQGIRLNDKYSQQQRVHNRLNLSNLIQVSPQKIAETTKVVNLSTVNTQLLRNKEYVLLEDFLTSSVDLSVLIET